MVLAMQDNKKKLVLIPGWGFDARVWQPILAELNLCYELICLDLPGRDLDLHINLDNMVAELEKNLPPRACYLGWSLGGLVAMRLARLLPARVEKLFLVGATPKFLAADNWPGMAMQTFDNFMHLVQHDPQRSLREFMALQLPKGVSSRAAVRQLREVCTIGTVSNKNARGGKNTGHFNHENPNHENPNHENPNHENPNHENPNHENSNLEQSTSLLASLLILRNTDLRQDLAQLKCQVHFILGGADQLIPAVISEYLMQQQKQQQSPLQITVIPDAGHAMFLTHTAQFLAVLAKHD